MHRAALPLIGVKTADKPNAYPPSLLDMKLPSLELLLGLRKGIFFQSSTTKTYLEWES